MKHSDLGVHCLPVHLHLLDTLLAMVCRLCTNLLDDYCKVFCYQKITLRERLRTHKVFTKDQCLYFNYHQFSIKSYVLDVYQNCLGEAILIHIHNI